jgi:hypothetical protein
MQSTPTALAMKLHAFGSWGAALLVIVAFQIAILRPR